MATFSHSKPASPDLVAFLGKPSAYGLESGVVEAKETHMSWVFMTRDRVFKLKKPLRTPFLDFSSLEARERFCKEEVRLNRRLAPSVYLRAAAVVMARDGTLSIEGEGRVVDWLVVMRRLPEERMLDRAIHDNSATPKDIGRALDLLFEFFAGAPPVDVARDRYLATLQLQHAQNGVVLTDKRFDLARSAVDETLAIVREIIDAGPGWLLEPLESRRIIEGHGDLRPEHICLTDPPAIIDCLEFNRDLRLVDPFDELSYLAMECRMLGAVELADSLAGRYAKRAGVGPSQILLDFYTAYRAAIRARLALEHLIYWPGRDGERWTAQGRAYLEAAHAASLKLRRR